MIEIKVKFYCFSLPRLLKKILIVLKEFFTQKIINKADLLSKSKNVYSIAFNNTKLARVSKSNSFF